MGEEAALIEVRLLGMPLHVRASFVQHTEGLMRELALVQLEAEQEAEQEAGRDAPATLSTLSPRLLQLAAELAASYAPFQVQPAAVMAAALAAGEEFCDVTYTLPRGIGPFVQRLEGLLEEADDFCRREEHLLTLPAPQEVVDYRRWLFGQFHRQLDGQPPRAWRRRFTARAAVEAVVAPAPARAAAPVPPARGGEPLLVGGGEQGAGELVGQPLVMQSMASSVAAARRYVRQVLEALGQQALEESAELGVSELVTNAMLHARTVFTLAVRTMPSGRVRIEVSDSSAAPLQPRRFSAAATTGRGLQLVASLSFDWGVEERVGPEGPGKTVWFEPKEVTDDVEAAAGFDAGDWDLESLH